MHKIPLGETPAEPAEEPLSIESWALKIFREYLGWKQGKLAAAVGTSFRMICRWETVSVPRAKLFLCTAKMGYSPAEVEALLYGLRKGLLPEPAEPWSPLGPTPEHRQRMRRSLGQLLYVAVDRLEAKAVLRYCARRARADRARAKVFWEQSLAPTKPEDREFLVAAEPSCQTWALAELLAHQSAQLCADDADAALELAQLALCVAVLATANDPEPWRCFVLGYVWLFVANALRVGPGFDQAEAASAKGWALWDQGVGVAPAWLLAEWRLVDLTASLRRDQRRFAEALELHDRARAMAPLGQAGRILLKKAYTYEQMTDYEVALATLAEAEPRIAGASDPRLRWVLLFNRSVVLGHLGRLSEAEAPLAEARALAFELGNALDQIRIRWLEGRLARERGDLAEAQAAFEHARQEFDRLKLPYDFALVSLDLALLRRRQSQWPQIRLLAAELVKSFTEHKIHREALASVILFQEAAAKEAVTVELVDRLRNYLETARRRPELRFEP